MTKLKLFTLFLSIISSNLIFWPSAGVSALNGYEFQPGRIIDDGVFFNGNDMSSTQVQSFLNSKLSACDSQGSKPYAGTTTGAYGSSKGYPPPYTCLKDFSMMTYSIGPDAYCNGFTGGSKTAAQIIYEVGLSCGINQKIILITLQKEQSLITDDWPWSLQYTKATGYGCPDSALNISVDANQNGCYDETEGFLNQVYYGARQFKRYAKDSHIFTQYRAYRNNYIQYNPDDTTLDGTPACGGTNVYIQNQATSGLYVYTPYQPNASALNNLYGTGDRCSAYGNRNFWRLFNDWFGNPLSLPYSASFKRVSNAPILGPTVEGTVWFDFQNTGVNFWKDEASRLPGYPITRLAGTWPINRVSSFAHPTWYNESRPTYVFRKVFQSDGTTLSSDQHTVHPGQIARFELKVKQPISMPGGIYRENFEVVQDGIIGWQMHGGYAWQNVLVPEPFKAEFKKVSPPANIKPGQVGKISFDFKNTGTHFWKDEASRLPGYPITRLAGTWPINRSSKFVHPTWYSPNRPTYLFSKVFQSDGTTLSSDQHTVHPGQIARFEFVVQYPDGGINDGAYKENFEVVQDGIRNWWTSGGYAWQSVNVTR